MPSARGGHRVKPAKVASKDTPISTCSLIASSPGTKPVRRNTDWKVGLSKPSFLSRSTSEPKQTFVVPPPAPVTTTLPRRQTCTKLSLSSPTAQTEVLQQPVDVPRDNDHVTQASEGIKRIYDLAPPIPVDDLSLATIETEEHDQGSTDTFEDFIIDETLSCGSSTYSRDRASVFSSDVASIYSSASSLYSSGASMYSFEEEGEDSLEARAPRIIRPIQRVRTNGVKRSEAQDAASRERSSLARKAAMFKNSRLAPDLPTFATTLPVWSMVCRAAKASQDCYDSQALTRRGKYTPANTSKDMKAMIVDDQLIDDMNLVIVAIRGTEAQSLADWSTNKDANPVRPIGLLDDEENACHAGFLQVAKAMVDQVATQLQGHTSSGERPALLFTGHSAGGAVAAMLCSHMHTKSVKSELISLADHFSNIHCITFGAPPLSVSPLPNQISSSDMFLAFANEGDPVLRLSDAAYMKSLAKLMTASPPAAASTVIAPPPVKVIRSSRGTRVIKTKVPDAPVTPWEELPLWPTPPAPLMNAGRVILLRDASSGSATASMVTSDELKDVIFGDFAQHTMAVYLRRVKDMAFTAMMGRNLV